MWDIKIIDTDKSLYIAIADAIERDIHLGILKASDKMPTHRELAKIIGVNVTTITRAYQEAEKRGLITSTVGRGTFITSDLGINPSLINTENHEADKIEMGLVYPLSFLEPDINPLITRVLHKNASSSLMSYSLPPGNFKHRQVACEWMRRFGILTDTSKIIITAGAQHALNCIFSSVFHQNDRIAMDYLTYPGAKAAAKRYGLHLEGVAMDEEGMLPQELEALCNRYVIKGIYTVSSIQNPTNAVMSEERRIALANIIKKYNLILVEDDLYRLLTINSCEPLTTLVPDQGIYIAGISKCFYAGLRISFVTAPTAMVNRISQAVVDTIWMAPPLNAEVACECITSGTADEIMKIKQTELQQRAELMSELLSGYVLSYVPYSMFVWLCLPEFWNSNSFERVAREHGVNVISSDKFTVGSIIPPNCIRLSLTGVDNRTSFEQGLDIIRRMLSGEIGPIGGVM